MKLEELKDALRAVDPAAVLVSNRLLGRVIKDVHHLPTQILQVPHNRSFVIDRQVLFRHVEQDELDLDPDRLLPPTVILLVRPSSEEGEVPDRPNTLLKYWQRLFHASIDRELDHNLKTGKLTIADLRTRIAAIGEAEFDEIRGVLARDLCLLPPVDEVEVYCEFVAVYLELRYFLPDLRAVYFPAVRDFAKIDALIAKDIDGDTFYKTTRLHGAPDPKARGDRRSDDSHEYYHKLMRGADSASLATNHVRAAIMRMKAARVAPGARTLDTRVAAHGELQHLTERLQKALQLHETDATAWHAELVSLLEKADQGPWTVEARLLYDLQQVCIAAERDVYKLDLVEWVLSAFKRPIKRPMPSQRLVQITRYLNAAVQRVPLARLSDADRQNLTRLLQLALRQSEEILRARFRPIFADALHDVGLVASNPPEETALRKMIEELLDRITAAGFFTFGDLRDVISRNNLKLPDLSDPQEFVRGDPLLRLDRRLATLLDGVYRSGEVYLRVLSRTTSLMFGTQFGRMLTLNVLLPFGGALAALVGLQHIIREPVPFTEIQGPDVSLAPWLTFIPVGLFILGLMHLPKMRETFVQAWQVTLEVGRIAINGPLWLMRLPVVQHIWKSWLFQLLWWFAVKPLAVALLVWLVLPDFHHPAISYAIVFGIVAITLISRLGHAASELFAVAMWQLYDKFRSGLIGGLVRLVMQLLKEAMDALERVLYSIDEWLRFRSGDTPASLVLRTVLGVIWYPIGFFTRLYVVVLVEPMFHPLKLPIAILAAKLMLPIYGQIYEFQRRLLAPIVGEVAASMIAAVNSWLSADLFGFLFWEFRENWRSYRANRSKLLTPVMVGHHGETVLQLLKPGFHSGTVSRLFDHLRRAERLAMATGQWGTARAYHQQLLDVTEAFRLFIERELLVLLHQSPAWLDKPLRTGKIDLAVHLVRIELDHTAFPVDPVRLALAEKAGWLTVQIEQPGWLAKLAPRQFEPFITALAGWYKMAGVQLVREQLQAALAHSELVYTIEDQGLALRPMLGGKDKFMVSVRDRVSLNLPLQRVEQAALPTLPPPPAMVFARWPIFWTAWVESWQRDQRGQAPQLLPPELALVPEDVRPKPQPVAEDRNGESTPKLTVKQV
ncbi:MAG TPA: hypothetical protein VE988_15740 [Gemmataceae bacterium]|nr:hypothetical protein [Gemmataceae bacterium]